MMEVFAAGQLRHPYALLILLIPLLALLRRALLPPPAFPAAWIAPEAHAALRRFSSRQLCARIAVAFFALAALSFAIALAGPEIQTVHERDEPARNILLVLDRSSSMREASGDSTRFKLLQDAVARFVRARENDRIGVVLFARFPDLLCPPTDDHEALLELLATIEPAEPDSEEDATAIGAGVARAARSLSFSLEKAEEERVLILFTDGVENVYDPRLKGEIAPTHAGQWCADMGVRVHVALAVADATGDARTERARQEVRQLAQKTGGLAFEAAEAKDLSQVFRAIDATERSGTQRFFVAHESYVGLFLTSGLVLLLAAGLLGLIAGRDLLA